MLHNLKETGNTGVKLYWNNTDEAVSELQRKETQQWASRHFPYVFMQSREMNISYKITHI